MGGAAEKRRERGDEGPEGEGKKYQRREKTRGGERKRGGVKRRLRVVFVR